MQAKFSDLVCSKGVHEHWNLKQELENIEYKVKKESNQHSCPYCGGLNRMHKYFPKGEYSKCEKCEKIFYNRSRKTGGTQK